MSYTNTNGLFDLDRVIIRKPVQFPDGSIQTTAYTGAGSSNLSQVLAVGNSAGAYDINLNNNDVTNVLNIIGSSGVGQDLSISSNNNISITADNIDLGTTEIIYPTLATPARLRLKASGQVQVDNNGGGTSTASCPIVLNQVSSTGGILTQEVYNQRTGVNGSFAQQSFYAKNNAGGKLECARISAVAENITNNRGQLDFGVAGVGGAVGSFISLSGNNQIINALRTLNLNSNDILNCSTISTPLTNFYAKQITPVFLNANTTISTNIENTARYNAFNAGRTPTWDNSNLNNFGGSVENITASIPSFAGYWVVGTNAGNIYGSNDNGVNWNLFYSFGARINCMEVYNGSSNLAVGGQFTQSTSPYWYVCAFDTNFTAFDITGGNSGLNNEVNCFFLNSFNNLLYIGGAFTDLAGGSGNIYGFIAYDWNSANLFPLTGSGSSGFTGGAVRTIAYDSNSQFCVVGGDFTDVISSGSSIGSYTYLFSFQTGNGYSITANFQIGNTSSSVYKVFPYSSNTFIIGGNFTTFIGLYSYGFQATWNGSGFTINDYPLYSMPSSPITNIFFNPSAGVYFTIENFNTIRQGSTLLPPIPTGSAWECVAFNSTTNYFSTNNQNAVGFILYALNNSLVITISSVGISFVAYSGVYTNCNLLGYGSSVEMLYNNGSWWVVAQNGVTFS